MLKLNKSKNFNNTKTYKAKERETYAVIVSKIFKSNPPVIML